MMAEKTGSIPQSFRGVKGHLLTWLAWGIFLGLLAALVVRIVMQVAAPQPYSGLRVIQDIPLPGSLPDPHRTAANPLAPGIAALFDHFDFQALDPNTHLLFIAHTGPNPDREQQVNPRFDPDTDSKTDGNIIVFDTIQKKVIRLLPIPQVAGVVVASDLHKVYAADANDDIIYAIDELAFHTKPIQLQKNDGPDSLVYDSQAHLIFVSNPGNPANPDQSQVIERKNQNETVINALTDKVVARIPLGVDGQWGDDVGHVVFDPGLHRVFVVVQQLPDPDSPDPNVLPPPGTAWIVEINPGTHRIITRLKLPDFCLTPHGMTIDTQQHIAFIACVDSTPASLIRVDIRSMQVIAEPAWMVEANPDLVVLDHPLHLVFVACATGISQFQERGRSLAWLGSYSLGVNTHTIAINEDTHEIYLPLPREGGRPVLRIMQYIESGT